MANLLKMALIETIQSLRAQRWSFRRIARELGIHRETVARYVRLAQSKPADHPSGGAPLTGSEASNSANGPESDCAATAPKPAKPPTGLAVGRSDCELWREIILAKLDAGLSAQRIFQDLTCESGFAGSYHIANLGHGLYPDTEVDKVKCFIDTVKEYSLATRSAAS